MDSKSFWNDYFQKSEIGLQLNYLSDEEIVSFYKLPHNFNSWCKGNINNAKFLFVSIVRKLLHENDIKIVISVSIGQKTLPINLKWVGDFKIGAKNLIQEAVVQSEHLDYLDIQDFSGILITDTDSISFQISPIIFNISQDLKSISVTSKTEFEEFSLGLIEHAIHIINPDEMPSPRAYSSAANRIIKEQNEFLQTKKEVIENAWKSVFEQSLNWDKNFYSNGGDSIQAIRFLSKLKEQGAKVDLSGLINAYSLSQWTFEITENRTRKNEIGSDPSTFSLTEMQQKIWSHYQSFKEHGAYHEQFLFELKNAPTIQIMESCINAIWKSYPNLRIQVKEINGVVTQNVIDSELKIIEYQYDSIDEALNEDRTEPFQESLLRLKIILIKNKSYLLWSHHHLIIDGWSVGILIREFIERITTRNYLAQVRPNFQYQLLRFEKAFPAANKFKEAFPIIFPINEYNKTNSFETISFERFSVDLFKENQITKDFQITKQLLFCGIVGIILRSFSDQKDFYFNGISSGRDFLDGEIDSAVGLFIRNIQISISIDEKTTWSSFYKELNENFQQSLSTKNRVVQNDDFANNSDFLFVYENYPYTDIKSKEIEAELIRVNEVTGYPITFCLFPNPEGYSLRIVYDARRFNEQFIEGLKLKFENTYGLLLNSKPDDLIISKNKKKYNLTTDFITIDSLTNVDLSEIGNLETKISFFDGPGWHELFNEKININEKIQLDGLYFWGNQLYSKLPGDWKDNFVTDQLLKLIQSISYEGNAFSVIIRFINFLKLNVWNGSEFQLNIQKDNHIFPLLIKSYENDDQLSQIIKNQLEYIDQYLPEFLSLFENNWTTTSNFLIIYDQSKPSKKWDNFDFILKLENGSIEIYKNKKISDNFTKTLIKTLSEFETFKIENNLSYCSNLNQSKKVDFLSFVEIFSKQVAASPNQIAIVDGTVKYTYLDLDRYSNQIARYLHSTFNLDKSNFIGVKFKRSAKQLASVLAILKIRKAFIPLDINWPEHRLHQVIKQSELKLIIDENTYNVDQLDKFSSETLVFDQKSIEAPFYCLFTSGSTGSPKGCVISEYSFLNYLDHCKKIYFNNSIGTNVHVFTPLTFDFTLTSFLGGIAFGCSVILHQEDENVYDSLKTALKDSKSAILKLTPSHISIAEKEWFKSSTSRVLIVGGEALTDHQIDKCLSNTSHKLINEYGPTEATVGCIFHNIKLNSFPLIGLPIDGMGALILDENNNIVTKGREGELCLFGNGLSNGYLNNENQTNISYEFWHEDASIRIYRTGDLVKMQDDGQMLYISRKDGQVKLNGYRIETEEISFAIKEICDLGSHSFVFENEQSKQLVTFVEGEVSSFDLIDNLRKMLPAYMVPSKVIVLQKFPLTSNGKLDTQKLKKNYLNSKIAIETEKSLNIEEIIEECKKLNCEFHSILADNSSKIKGWGHLQKQIHLLYQIQASKTSIFIPKSIEKIVPQALSNLQNSIQKITENSSFQKFNRKTFTIEEIQKYSQLLKSSEIKLADMIFEPFSKTINNLIDSIDFEIPIDIESNHISFLQINEKALVRDWTSELGFPFILHKNLKGKLICLLPSRFFENIIDSIGNYQPVGWEGNLPFINTNNFTFKNDNGQLLLERRNSIVRFSQILNLTCLEGIVYEYDNHIENVYSKELENRIYVYIQTKEAINVNLLEKFIQNKLPAWCKIEKIIITTNIEDVANENEFKHVCSSFSEFLELNLPEYSYLDGEQSLIEQGGDSITALRIVGKLKNKGFQIEVGTLLNSDKLSEYLLGIRKESLREINSHILKLTPIQQWFLSDFDGNKNHYNQSVLLEVLLPIESTVLVNAIHQTLQNFKLLSKIYSDDWKEGIAPKTEFFKCENEAEVTKKCSIIQESFDLKTGPVAGSAVFELDNKNLFFISIHHFYCDGYSWRLILDELQQVLQSRGSEHTSKEVFGKVHQRFLDLGNETKLSDKNHFGESILNPFTTWKAVDFKTSSYVEWEWNEPETRWFQFNDQIGKSTNEKFLYLFVRTWQSLYLPISSFFFETHGRSYDGIPEITEAIGWFTQFYPVFTTRFPNDENLINDISEELKNLPNNGLTYMAMENSSKPPFPVLLNFLGNFDEESSSIVRSSKISQGKMTDDANPMLSFVELNAMIFEGKLKWMLRTHPDFNCSSFMETFNSIAKEVIDGGNSISIVSDQIDQDDMDAINDLLGGM